MRELNFHLRDLPFAARLGLTLLVLVNLGGFLASGLHMVKHYENRDQRDGLSMTDHHLQLLFWLLHLPLFRSFRV